MLDINALLDELKAAPYVESAITAPHCGLVNLAEPFKVLKPGKTAKVQGASGTWKEKPGTLLATLNREHNPKPLRATENAEVVLVHGDLDGQFVEAGAELMRIRHFLSSEEVMAIILQKSLHLFCAPERARYYFVPAVDVKVKNSGPQSVSVTEGQELFIMSRMKREVPLRYTGPAGVVYAVYFSYNCNVEAGAPLIGVCPPDLLGPIEEAGHLVRAEWSEK